MIYVSIVMLSLKTVGIVCLLRRSGKLLISFFPSQFFVLQDFAAYLDLFSRDPCHDLRCVEAVLSVLFCRGVACAALCGLGSPSSLVADHKGVYFGKS